MEEFKKKIENYSKWLKALKESNELRDSNSMPGSSYFIDDNDILTIARHDGDCRYPYGKDGFNFWAYTSGYMHCNEGLFSVFLRANEGQEPKIAFFAGFPDGYGKYNPIPLLSVPANESQNIDFNGIDRYTIFSKSCVYYITEVKGLRFAIRIFADENKKIYFTLYIENLEKTKKKFYISTFINPFLSHSLNEDGESRWFREVQYIDSDNNGELGSFIIKVNEDISRTTSVSNIGVIHRSICLTENSSIIRHEETASRYLYVGGSMDSLHSPRSLYMGGFANKKHICAFTEVGVAGDIIHMEIGEKDSIRYDEMLSYKVHCSDDSEANELLNELIDQHDIDKKLDDIDKIVDEHGEGLKLKFYNSQQTNLREGIFNAFFEHLKTQVEFCSLIKGYVQLSAGSLIGIRDIFQALEGLVFWRPEAVRNKMLEAFEFILENGRCPRQYTLPVSEGLPPVMDLRAFIDQGVWLISTVITYLRVTGDRNFLNELRGYYEIVDETKGLVKKCQRKDSVLEHLFKVMDYLLSNRDFSHTGCIRVLYGDWNDALDGLGVSTEQGKEYGTGVSVMASLQVYQNLNEMVELLTWLDGNKYSIEIKSYKAASEELYINLRKYAVINNDQGESRIVHGWGDKRSYFVGSFEDPDHLSRIGLTSNAFWVLGGMNNHDRYMEDTILQAFRTLDSKYGFKTFEPAFDAKTQGVGRIPKLPAGTAENGAVYVHASAFAVMALFKMGHAKEAWDQLCKLLPFTHDRISCSPYIMPNSYGYNEEKGIDGESMLDWQTGSSNVIFKTFIGFVIGIKPEFDGVWLQPAKGLPFEGFTFQITIRECIVSITYKNSENDDRRYFIDNNEKKGTFNECMNLKRLWISAEDFKRTHLSILVED